MTQDKSILLIGLGAIGSVLYRRLDLKNYKVVCLTSVESSKLIRKKGLRVKLTTDETIKLHECEVYNELPDNYIFDNCIIATKSWINKSLSYDLNKHLNETASILLFQNGINIEDDFLRTNSNWKIVRAITSLAAFRKQKNEAYEASIGETKIGLVNLNGKDVVEEWKRILTNIGLNVKISENIQRDIWLKATVNCTIGPLAAITELKNGEILKDAFLNRIVISIIKEMITVIPLELSISLADSLKLIDQITEQTSNHKASMLQDIEKNKKTEINELNGQIIKIAERKDIEVPINKKIVELVKQIAERRVPKEQIILELKSL